ncbi:hypothetical protein [Robertmurraya siralis]|uniref:hypothetical protein n=1 Tax=Robertmurraya siralis TaxID=77777 RepID=UPI0010F5281E|nr:hypothetical protein [Robertmurraya siralis]
MSSGKDNFKCTSCGEEKDLNKGFYMSYSPFHKATNRLHVCKVCLANEIKDGDMKSFVNMLRGIDKPFITHLYESALEKNSVLGEYFKLINTKDFRYLTWENSDFEGHKKTDVNNLMMENEIEYDEETVKYWGRGYSDWEYMFLEDERHKLMSSFECPDYGMEMIMKDICFINLDIEKARQERKDTSAKTIMNLIETRRQLMTDANMKPIQSTGAEGNDQVTFGTLIKKWEDERPIPVPMDDEIKEYIDTFMVGHLAKMEGLNNDLTDKYDEALSKYTINLEDINKTEEEFEE